MRVLSLSGYVFWAESICNVLHDFSMEGYEEHRKSSLQVGREVIGAVCSTDQEYSAERVERHSSRRGSWLTSRKKGDFLETILAIPQTDLSKI